MTAPRDPRDPSNWAPIDDRALGGRSHLVRKGEHWALGRWNGFAWVFSGSGVALDFEPETFFVREAA